MVVVPAGWRSPLRLPEIRRSRKRSLCRSTGSRESERLRLARRFSSLPGRAQASLSGVRICFVWMRTLDQIESRDSWPRERHRMSPWRERNDSLQPARIEVVTSGQSSGPCVTRRSRASGRGVPKPELGNEGEKPCRFGDHRQPAAVWRLRGIGIASSVTLNLLRVLPVALVGDGTCECLTSSPVLTPCSRDHGTLWSSSP